MHVTAIFGGTFNPFHIGHYEMMLALEKCDEVEKILLMPDRIPPHKVCDFLASDSDRIAMCKEIVSEFSKAELCLIEFERQGKSYSYDTVIELKSQYPDTEFAFVCGGDMLVSFDKWYNYEKLMKLVSFIVFKRSDTDLSYFNNQIEKFSSMGMKIKVMENLIPAVSSTFIRNNIEESKNFLPMKIWGYIKNRGIYNAEQR